MTNRVGHALSQLQHLRMLSVTRSRGSYCLLRLPITCRPNGSWGSKELSIVPYAFKTQNYAYNIDYATQGRGFARL